jgi:hypothetical protein
MKKQAKDELEEMFESLGELDEVRALTRSKLAADVGRKATKPSKSAPRRRRPR